MLVISVRPSICAQTESWTVALAKYSLRVLKMGKLNKVTGFFSSSFKPCKQELKYRRSEHQNHGEYFSQFLFIGTRRGSYDSVAFVVCQFLSFEHNIFLGNFLLSAAQLKNK